METGHKKHLQNHTELALVEADSAKKEAPEPVATQYVITPSGGLPSNRTEWELAISVTYAGRGWKVGFWRMGEMAYDRDVDDHVPEPLPSNRDEDFYRRCRFELDEALAIARRLYHQGLRHGYGWLAPADYADNQESME